MASGTVLGGESGNDGGGGGREKQRYIENKVYTRRAFKGPRNNLFNTIITANSTNTSSTPATSTSGAAASAPTTSATADPTTSATTTSAITCTTSITETNANRASNTITGVTSTSSSTSNNNDESNNKGSKESSSNDDKINDDNNNNSCSNDDKIEDDDHNDRIFPSATGVNTAAEATVHNSSVTEKDDDMDENEESLVKVQESEAVGVEDGSLVLAKEPVLQPVVVSEDSHSLNQEQVVGIVPVAREPIVGNGVVKELDGGGKIDLVLKTKKETRDLRRKLETELDTVRRLVEKIEAKERELGTAMVGVGGLSNPRVSVSDGVRIGLKRLNSGGRSFGFTRESTASVLTPTPRQTRPLNQLSISVLENSQGVVEHVEKEKRTPKANQFYRNSEFFLANDKFPPAESNKKSKVNVKKHGHGDLGGFGTGTKLYKSCAVLLEKLMKHKYGWVFNTPVDVKLLGLHDYFTIIKHPMDLGTVKAKLNKNWYKSPEEFAEDVRLTFHNAMRYNPKGQDVHVMADQLLSFFETKWVDIKFDYDRERSFANIYDMGFPTPTSRKAPPFSLPHLDMRKILDRSDSMMYPVVDARQKPISTTPSSRTPVARKPKARDPHKRDMTYDEKHKLSTNLSTLPAEKLDNIVQIIKKRNESLLQDDGEIEVDIDNVDAETLWELDRFVTNYKKSLSKNKRKAELAIQTQTGAEQNGQQKAAVPVAVDVPQETKADEGTVSTSLPAQVEKQGDNGSRSSSSSSSSSDSGSSSSDSDSDSSSGSESDVGH